MSGISPNAFSSSITLSKSAELTSVDAIVCRLGISSFGVKESSVIWLLSETCPEDLYLKKDA